MCSECPSLLIGRACASADSTQILRLAELGPPFGMLEIPMSLRATKNGASQKDLCSPTSMESFGLAKRRDRFDRRQIFFGNPVLAQAFDECFR